MQIQTNEIQPEIFRISAFESGEFLSFNHFLIRDEKTTLIHTGHQKNFNIISNQISHLINPKDIAYICFSHFEPDECGSIKQWLEISPNASVCVNKICDSSLRDVVEKPSKILKDGDRLPLGGHELLFLEAPHFPHTWEACLFYETKTKTLFASDLGSQQGFPQEAGNQANLQDIISLQTKFGFICYGPQFSRALRKIRQLDIDKMATMHGVELDREATNELLSRLEIENNKAMETALRDFNSLPAQAEQLARTP
jgi:flavorubredoxin